MTINQFGTMAIENNADKIKRKSAYIAFTPYNIFLSYGIALSNQEKFDQYLLVFSEFSQSELFLKALINKKSSPFHKVISYYHGHSFFQKIKKFFALRKSVKKVKKFFEENKIDVVYVCSDTKIISQIILRHLEKLAHKPTCIYIEEGIAPYHTMTYPKHRIQKKIITRILYGSWLENVLITGSSRWIDEIQAVFPQYVRPELRQKKIGPYPKEVLLELKNKNYFDDYYRLFQLEKEELKKINAIILVENSRFTKDHTKNNKDIYDLVNKLKEKNMFVAIKYHPNEPLKDYLSLANKNMVSIMPQAFPCEFLYLDGLTNLKIIIGGVTTALVTARWILDDVRIISIAKMTPHSNDWMSKTFDQLDIEQVNSLEDAKKII